MKSLRHLLRSVGPALIVAAIVLGPGSILTSSQVGSQYGYPALFAIGLATVLMIGMVALAARIGVIYDDSPCDQLTSRLGRPVAIAVGLILFGLVAIFQFSNNVAIISGLAPLWESSAGTSPLHSGQMPNILLIAFNAFVIICLYALRHLYHSLEKVMKLLIGLMVLAFLTNFVVVSVLPRGYEPVTTEADPNILALLGMMGTTFSVGGAFYQAYLVKEKGWGLADARRGLLDSALSIGVLGLVTAIILMTATRVFYGRPEPVALGNVGDVARQLEPLFGSWAKVIFCLGIFAGAISSFLVNALIGGTVLSDAIGKGSRLEDRWPLHLTTVALLCGMIIAILHLRDADSTVNLIIFAQSLTVLGLPVLALTLLYLGSRPDLTGDRRVPRWILGLGGVGFVVALGLAYRLILAVLTKLGWLTAA